MRLAWLTDLHLDFVRTEEARALCDGLLAQEPNAVLLCGDIATGNDVDRWLRLLVEHLAGLPMYFVLGNHDFYYSRIANVRTQVAALSSVEPSAYFLDRHLVAQLSPNTALVGHSGWADGRAGDYDNSQVVLNDHLLINDFVGLNRWSRLKLMQELADAATDHARRVLPGAFSNYQHVVFATHAPPFAQATLFEGQVSDADHLPHFCNRGLGEALFELMAQRPHQQLTVLCGHTHAPADHSPAPNIWVRVGGAKYGAPELQEPVDLL